MIKSVSLIGSALLAFGLAAGSMAADMPNSAAPTAADSGAGTTDAAKPVHKHKSRRAARANKRAKRAANTANTNPVNK